jgi:pteridine reductase
VLELAGKRALVTGAGRRVGAEIAAALGEQRMRVAVHYQASKSGALATCERIVAAGGEALALPGDLRDKARAKAVVDEAIDSLGGLELLVLSAASFERVAFGRIREQSWDDAIALNLTAPFVMAQHAAATLRSGRGSIVLVTCISRLSPYRDYLPYEVSKAGLYQLMRLLALELAPDVRVNAVAPGSVLPPEDWQLGENAALLERIPLGRLGRARDVADAVVHLAKSEWLTGTEIPVDGGRSLL